MRKKIILVLLLNLMFLFVPVISGSEINFDWHSSINIDMDYGDGIYNNILEMPDGYLVSGLIDTGTGAYEGYKSLLVKYDKEGNVLWHKKFGDGNLGESWEIINNMILTKSGDILIVGMVKSTLVDGKQNLAQNGTIGAKNYGYIAKIDKDGNVLWQKRTEKTSQYLEAVEISDEFFISAASFLSKYDKDGNLLWEKDFFGCSRISNFIIKKDELILGCSTMSKIEGITNNGSNDAVIIKFDLDGNIKSNYHFGSEKYDYVKSIHETSDGGLIVIVYSGNDIFILKYDKEGNKISQLLLDGSNNEEIDKSLLTKDDSLILVGATTSSDLDIEGNIMRRGGFILKFDKNFTLQWYKNTGYDYVDADLAVDDEIFVLSNFNQDIFIRKYDKFGNEKMKSINYGGNNTDVAKKIIATDNKVIIVGQTWSNDLENIRLNTRTAVLITKFKCIYDINLSDSSIPNTYVEQQGKYGLITSTPNEGYEVDKIIIKDKDGNVLDLVVTKLEDGTYTFELYDDVSVEVLFKEIATIVDKPLIISPSDDVINPKTGVSGYIGAMFTIFIIGICAFFMIRNCNNSYEL